MTTDTADAPVISRPELFVVLGDYAEVKGWHHLNPTLRYIRAISDATVHGLKGPLVVIQLPGAMRLGEPMRSRIFDAVARVNAVAYTKPIRKRTATTDSLTAVNRGDDEIQALIGDLAALLQLPAVERVRVLSDWVNNDGGSHAVRSRLHRIRALAALQASEESTEQGQTRDQLAVQMNLGSGRAYDLISAGRKIVAEVGAVAS